MNKLTEPECREDEINWMDAEWQAKFRAHTPEERRSYRAELDRQRKATVETV